MFSALCVNHSHQLSALVGVGDELDVGLAGRVGRSGTVTVGEGDVDRVAAWTIADEAGDADKEGSGVAEETGGSSGVSSGVLSSSEWRPTGFKGRRRVPLLARGVIPMESQTMLYTSMFSVLMLVFGFCSYAMNDTYGMALPDY